MKTKIKYFYFDLDGTLLDSQKQIRPDLLAKINGLREKHKIKIGLASGRCYLMMKYLVHLLKPDLPTITNNGASIVSPDGMLSTNLNFLSFEQAKEIVTFIENHQGEYLIYTDSKIYTNSLNNWRIKFLLENGRKQGLKEFLWEYHLIDWEAIKKQTILKILCCTFEISNLVSEKIKNSFSEVTTCSSEANLLDIYHKKADKYWALVQVSEIFKFNLQSELLYFGDNNNDFLSISKISNSVCVGREVPYIAATAKYVTNSADQNGILNFLNKHYN